ncbi:hypothetical protein E2C01_005692 [Portunus trituberculatus]|uniref:Uncharacterized protein n=1 Tax=Portunus trituberculatus TaxID=210409 RepID=A0A5B7CV13_PORTR|nr:hypothetical protein [Portunus trituberculatus]
MDSEMKLQQVEIGMTLTRNGAEKTQRGSLTRVLVDHAFAGGLRHWDGEGDGLVEFAAAWLHSHYWRDSYSVAQEFSNQYSQNLLIGLLTSRQHLGHVTCINGISNKFSVSHKPQASMLHADQAHPRVKKPAAPHTCQEASNMHHKHFPHHIANAPLRTQAAHAQICCSFDKIQTQCSFQT